MSELLRRHLAAIAGVALRRDQRDTLAGRHPISGSDLRRAIQEVASGRGATLAALSDVLDGHAAFAQTR
jgi:hypothetical protein